MTAITGRARALIRHAVLTLVRESGGQVTRITRGEPGAGWTEDAAGPLEGIAAARHLQQAAAAEIRSYARAARDAGLSWEQVGVALGGACDPALSPAAGAFRLLASDLGSGLSFGYTCGTCEKTVIDRGPEMGHPHDAERGHAEGCTRLAATVAAWEESWADD